MKRTDADGSVEGKFSDGSPEQGLPATVINAEFLNNIQEEICNFIEQAGLALDGTDQQQLRKALLAVFAAGISVGDSSVHGSGSGAASSATLNHDKLGVAATGDVAAELHAEFVKFIRGQKIAQIGTKIVENNIVVTVNEIVEFAKNLIVKNILTVEGNATFQQDVGIAGALNVGGTVRSEGGFSGGVSGRNGESANYPLIRADQILPRTNGGKIAVDGNNINLSGVLAGLFSGTITGSWIPGESVYFKYAMDVVNPITQMQDLPDGTVGIFYNKNSSGTYIIQWWDMDHTQRSKTVDSGTPFVFMKKKNSSNQECGLLLSVGEA